MNSNSILVTGASGQIGTDLIIKLRERYGNQKVIATDIKEPKSEAVNSGPFEQVDVLNRQNLGRLFEKYQVSEVYHLAAFLSAKSEAQPELAWKINVDGLLNVLESCCSSNVEKLFWPSSIAVFGPSSPKNETPQETLMAPNTIYGISKVAGEQLCNYYFEKKGLDVRSVRYPGIISYNSPAGGGSTDYAVDAFFDAISEKVHQCFLSPEMKLPMMYMPDAIKATLSIMDAPAKNFSTRMSYNIAAFSFSPKDLERKILEIIPGFEMEYQEDFRQKIAEGWPRSIDDKLARADWGWKPDFNFDEMVQDMIANVQEILAVHQE